MNSQFAPETDTNNSYDSEYITINGFIFCARHGLEVCDKCPTDNRSCNNEIVEKVLHEKLTEEEYQTKWKGDDRAPLSVANKYAKKDGKPVCMDHKQLGCNDCFDWGEKLYRDIHGHRKARGTRQTRKKRESERMN
ncbi:hypothetical protein BDB01DRAFT_799866 [Pilobolus umbonatus]|nr:hypothetical protein BDB01DRAFT_799866 [Pilobolus umbonatus]